MKHMARRFYHTLSHPHIGEGDFVIRKKWINGYQMIVFAGEDVGCQIYCYGRFEKEETRLIAALIKENDVCLDIGANIGYYTLLMASKAKKGKVHSFEPVARNYHLLCLNVVVNGYENVIANCCAIGNISGDHSFMIAQDGAYSSFIDTKRKPIAMAQAVRVQTLDLYCQEKGIDRIDFMKVDVEGAEKMVLEGAARLLQDENCRPKVMMMELYEPMLQQYSSSIDDVLKRLKGHSYEAFVSINGKMVPFGRDHYNKMWNVFFIST